MNFISVVKDDLKTLAKSPLFRISLIGIIIVPVLYSLLYLKAFWNPYGSLDDLPVAVVNLDKGSTVDGKQVNYGNDVIDSLKENKNVKWDFVSKKEAYKGLNGDKYYAIFQIDSNFSKQILSAKNGKAEKASMKYICNEKKNYLAAQVSSKIESTLKEEVQSSITKNYVTGAFDNLYEVKDGMTEASNGSKKITNGLKEVNNSVPMLSDGVSKLSNGSNELYNGQNALNNGLFALNNGLHEINSKSAPLKDGVSKLSNGAGNINSNLGTVYSSSKTLSDGTNILYDNYANKIYPAIKALNNGSAELNKQLQGNSSSLNALKQGADTIKSSSTQLTNASKELTNGYSNVKKGTEQLITSTKQTSDVMNEIASCLSSSSTSDKDKINNALKILQNYSNATSGAKEQLDNLQQGLNTFDNGLNTYTGKVYEYAKGSSTLADGTNTLISSVNTAGNAVNEISTGLNTLETSLSTKDAKGKNYGDYFNDVNNGQKALSDGALALYNGSKELKDGINNLNGNMPTLVTGLNKLYNGSTTALTGSNKLVSGQKALNDGVQTLSSKVPTLTDGVKKLYNGSNTLTKALTDGSAKLQDGLVNSADDMGDFVSGAADLKVKPVNEVGCYGAGFAPYFMNLSLWVGAIMMYFVISLKTGDDKNTSKFNKVFGKFITSSIVGICQAILVGLAIMAIGLRPKHLLAYFASLIFLSLVYISIVQLLITLFNDAGRLLAIVLLVLQLASCGGTFPIELVPKVFQVLNPFMPFTYGVSILREVSAAVNMSGSLMAKNFIILGIVMVCAITITCVSKNFAERFNEAFEAAKNKYLSIAKKNRESKKAA